MKLSRLEKRMIMTAYGKFGEYTPYTINKVKKKSRKVKLKWLKD